MADGTSDLPSGVDRRWSRGVSSTHKGERMFSWTAPSPSPAEVAGLEHQFPDVIQLPTASIDRETEVWSSSGVIVRSLSRWIPPDAVIREFRRAGLAGRIDSIALAHRTILLRFELPAARDAALAQPWVVNGQPLAMEAWRPDFVPADGAVRHALLWIRLPNLPLEYWNEETLCSILSVAGEFVGADAFTKERRRGSFARACVRVDLSKPLRPGARFRAHGSPFWQQFAYEHVDCICVHCGSLHLTGPCSSSSAPGSSAVAPLFGPWMAALRHRIPSAVVDSKGKASAVDSSGKAYPVILGDKEGWVKPGKSSRRKAVPSPSSSNVSFIFTESQEGLRPCQESSPVPVTVDPGKTAASAPGASSGNSSKSGTHSINQIASKGRRKNKSSNKQKEKIMCSDSVFQFKAAPSMTKEVGSGSEFDSQSIMKGKVAANPFSLLGSDRWAGCSKVRDDANPASLKRPRAVEFFGPELPPEALTDKDRVSSQVSLLEGAPPLCSQGNDAHEVAVTALKAAIVASSSVSRDVESPSLVHSVGVPLEPVQQPMPDQAPLMQCLDLGTQSDMMLGGAHGEA